MTNGVLQLRERLQRLRANISRRKRDIVVVICWSIAVTLLIMKSYTIYYVQNPNHINLYYVAPIFTALDRVLLVVLGFLVGMMLTDVKSLVLGYFSSMLISYISGMVFVSLYHWANRGYEAFFLIDWGWEYIVSFSLVQIWRFMIPIGFVFCLIGLVVGNATRIFVNP